MTDDTRLNDDNTRLNIDRARAALARARMDEAAAAVRSPRPADLSRLQEDQARAETLNTRVTAFRDSVRSQLGLGDYTGPMTAAGAGLAMTTPLCDADICAPVAPMMKAPDSADVDTIISNDASQTASELKTDPKLSDVDPIAINESALETAPLTEAPVAVPPMPQKRKKFLGIF